MKRFAASLFAVSAVTLAISIDTRAQDKPAAPPAPSTDPRAALKAGFRDAGQVARHMELVSTMPKPQGFFDPKAPAGSASPPRAAQPAAQPQTGPEPAAPANRPPQPQQGQGLNFSNSDIAFRRADMFLGNFNGFNTYDIE